MKPTDTAPWIGLVEVRARPGNDTLGGAPGAFVNIVALATSEQSFIERVSACLEEYGFDPLDFTDVVLFEEWSQRNSAHQDIEELVALLSAQNPVQFDEFQAYEESL
jgi:hypothetical protein